MLCTSGATLTKNKAEQLTEAGLREIQISLDSHEKCKNDAYRKGPFSAYDTAIQAISFCVSSGLHVTVGVTVHNQNLEDLNGLAELAENLGATRLRLSPVAASGRAVHQHIDLSPSNRCTLLTIVDCIRSSASIRITLDDITTVSRTLEGKVISAFANKATNGNPTLLGCAAGTSLLAISSSGEVYPCPMLPISCGNILQQSLNDIIFNSAIINSLRSRSLLKGKCGSCFHKVTCAGCRANAYAFFSDYLAEDPFCNYAGT
jgi:radical SAM protein with 4Fe4S-binding SPASM domain